MCLDKLPGVAEVAMQSGLYAGRRIRHRIGDGKSLASFRYYDLGSAAYLSRGNAVVSAGPLRFAGFAGWLGWLFIHIAFLTGFRNRVGAVLTWAAAFARDARRERTFTIQQIERLHDVYDVPRGRDHPTSAPGQSQT
jgi:NADH dehydrogenase